MCKTINTRVIIYRLIFYPGGKMKNKKSSENTEDNFFWKYFWIDYLTIIYLSWESSKYLQSQFWAKVKVESVFSKVLQGVISCAS